MKLIPLLLALQLASCNEKPAREGASRADMGPPIMELSTPSADASLRDGSTDARPIPQAPRLNLPEVPAFDPLQPSDLRVPAGEHPRVFIRQADLPALRARYNDPAYADYREAIEACTRDICRAFRYLMDPSDKQPCIDAIRNTYNATIGIDDASYGDAMGTLRGQQRVGIVYDWCYPEVPAADRAKWVALVKQLIAVGPGTYPLSKQSGMLVGHQTSMFASSYAGALAVYDEDPSIFDDGVQALFDNYLENRNFLYPSGAHWCGNYRGYFAGELMLEALFSTLHDTKKTLFHPAMRRVQYEQLYNMRPDRLPLRRGDLSDHAGRYNGFLLSTQLAAHYFRDPYLKALLDTNHYRTLPHTRSTPIFGLLYDEPRLQTRPLEELPGVYYVAPPMGGRIIARTGWDISGDKASSTAVVEMEIGETFWGNHDHQGRFGTFQVYYRGNLTSARGNYQTASSKYGSKHSVSFYRPSVSRNSLLIEPPGGEDWSEYNNQLFDGGVRPPYNSRQQPNNHAQLTNPENGYRYGKELWHQSNVTNQHWDYAAISGDITAGFSGKEGTPYADRAEEVTRTMVSFNTGDAQYPLVLMVFDRVRVADASAKKTYLLQAIEPPYIEGKRSTLVRNQRDYSGKLVNDTLLPEDAQLSYNAGFMVAGADLDPGVRVNGASVGHDEPGAGRIEIRPGGQRNEDLFLNAMAVMKADESPPAAAKLIDAGPMVGAQLLDTVALFARDGQAQGAARWSLDASAPAKVLVCNLLPGWYDVKRDGELVETSWVGAQGGCAYFVTSGGEVSVEGAPSRG